MAGGMPPPAGGDPAAAGGGAPPPPPSGGGGDISAMIQSAVQTAMAQQGGGAAGAASGAPLKPKIDVNVEIMQMKNLLAKIVDHLGIQVPAQDMTATPDKLMAMSQGQSTATPPGEAGAAGGAGAGGAGAGSAIAPIDPMQGASPSLAAAGGAGGGGSKSAATEFGEAYTPGTQQGIQGHIQYANSRPPIVFGDKAAAMYAQLQATRKAESNAA
jgi:hypothetical protein